MMVRSVCVCDELYLLSYYNLTHYNVMGCKKPFLYIAFTLWLTVLFETYIYINIIMTINIKALNPTV